MTRHLSLLLIASLSLAVGACTGTPTPAVATNTSSTEAAYPYPPPEQPATAPPDSYPSGQAVEPTPIPEPTPTTDPTLGVVRGVLLLRGRPVANYPVYLGELLKDQSGQESVVALDLVKSPSAITAADGSFRVVNVASGRYGLILVTTRDSYHLLYPDRNESVIVTVSGGGQVDVGVLDYENLPIILP